MRNSKHNARESSLLENLSIKSSEFDNFEGGDLSDCEPLQKMPRKNTPEMKMTRCQTSWKSLNSYFNIDD